MKSTLPKTLDEWLALALFPFKVWVLVALPFDAIFGAYVSAHHVRYGRTALGMGVMKGYMISVAILLMGALIQSVVCKRGTATRTLLYAVWGAILFFAAYTF